MHTRREGAKLVCNTFGQYGEVIISPAPHPAPPPTEILFGLPLPNSEARDCVAKVAHSDQGPYQQSILGSDG